MMEMSERCHGVALAVTAGGGGWGTSCGGQALRLAGVCDFPGPVALTP